LGVVPELVLADVARLDTLCSAKDRRSACLFQGRFWLGASALNWGSEMDWRESLELNDVLESPIERRLVGGLLSAHEAEEANVRFLVRENRADELPIIKDAERWPGLWLHIFPQEPVGPYRVDFLAVASLEGRVKSLVIECDGKDFHTDWQKDFDRDMFMKRLEYGVIRLRGTDIYRHPRECGRAVIEKAYQLLNFVSPTEAKRAFPEQQPLYPDTLRHLVFPLKTIFPQIEWNYLAEQTEKDKAGEDDDA
jgi:very-short-patch-repair endonuclease